MFKTEFMRFILLSMFLFLIATSCRCKKEASNSISSIEFDIQSYAKKQFGNDYMLSFNKDSSFVVVFAFLKNRPSDIFPTLNYKLLETHSLDLVFEDIVPRAEIEWVDNYIIEVKAEKGIPNSDDQSNQPMIYRYHAKNRKKYIPGGFGNKN